MVDYTPVHGIDFIIDFYSLLNVERTASKEDIESSFKTLIKKWHPDTLSMNAPEEMRKEMEKKSYLLNLAHKILSDQEKRQIYDASLNSFDESLISKNGVPIVNLTKRRLDLDGLVNGIDQKMYEKEENMLAAMSGYDKNTLNVLREAYKANPENEGIRKAYKSMLENEATYLNLQEEFAWGRAGVANQPDTKLLMYPEHHLEKRMGEISNLKKEISDAIDNRLLAIEGGYAAKLLPAGISEESSKAITLQQLKEPLMEAAMKTLDANLPKLTEIASERAKNFEEMLEFTDFQYILNEGKGLKKDLLILFQKEDCFEYLAYRLDNQNLRDTSEELGLRETIKIEDLPEELVRETSFIKLNLNKEIDTALQVHYVIDKHFSDFEGQKPI